MHDKELYARIAGKCLSLRGTIDSKAPSDTQLIVIVCKPAIKTLRKTYTLNKPCWFHSLCLHTACGCRSRHSVAHRARVLGTPEEAVEPVCLDRECPTQWKAVECQEAIDHRVVQSRHSNVCCGEVERELSSAVVDGFKHLIPLPCAC